MFRDIFTNRLFIGALAFFVLCVAGSLLYMHHENQKGAEYAAETEERVRQWNEKQKEQPAAEAPVVEQPEQVGHVHEDGTSHEETHEKPEQPTLQAPQLQKYAQDIPEHLLEAQRLVAIDPERARAAFRDALPEDPFSAEFEVAVKDAVQTKADLYPIVFELPQGDPRRAEFAIANNLLIAVFGEAMRLKRRYDDPSSVARAEEILSWDDPYQAPITNTTQLEKEKNQ